MSEELKKFYKAKSHPKKGILYGYDDDGNLVERNKDGGIVKTIPLPTYRPLTLEEIDEMEKKHRADIAAANTAFDAAMTALHEEFKKPQRNDSLLLQLNRAVEEADMKLKSIRFPHTHCSIQENIKVRQLDFTQPNETRVFPYPIFMVENNPYLLQEQYVRIGKLAEKAPVTVQDAFKAIKAQVAEAPVILFYKPDSNEYGVFSLDWAVDLEFNGTMYHSAKQAVAAEMAKQFEDQENLQKIMLTESAEAVEYSIKDVPEGSESLWNDRLTLLLRSVNLLKFSQYPELKSKLVGTGNAVLGAYEPNDMALGIGISWEDPRAKKQEEWTGQNLLGKALMEIRATFLAEQPAPKPLRKRPGVASRVPRAASAAANAVPKEVHDVTTKETPVTAVNTIAKSIANTGEKFTSWMKEELSLEPPVEAAQATQATQSIQAPTQIAAPKAPTQATQVPMQITVPTQVAVPTQVPTQIAVPTQVPVAPQVVQPINLPE